MRAEDTLQYMTDFYPEIFPTRKHCLDHLFCVVGNGYEWVNGELVDDDSEYEKRYILREPIKKAEFKRETNWYRMNKFYSNLYNALNDLGEKRSIPMEYKFEWYPLSKEYSALFTYPDDIKDDWKALVEECKQMLIDDGVDIENV
jgi:hypothetical protein